MSISIYARWLWAGARYSGYGRIWFVKTAQLHIGDCVIEIHCGDALFAKKAFRNVGEAMSFLYGMTLLNPDC